MRYLTVKNIYNRLIAEGPTFFNKLRKLMIACGVMGAALIVAQNTYPKEMSFVPSWLAGYLIFGGVLGTFISSLTVSNPDSNPKVN